MIGNLDVLAYIKTRNHRKTLQKRKKNNNLLNTKGLLIPKYKLKGVGF